MARAAVGRGRGSGHRRMRAPYQADCGTLPARVKPTTAGPRPSAAIQLGPPGPVQEQQDGAGQQHEGELRVAPAQEAQLDPERRDRELDREEEAEPPGPESED